jgi:DNA repair protein RadC
MLETQTAGYSLQDHDLIFGEPQTEYVLRFKDLPDDERPRERLLKAGAANLSLAELIAIVWGFGTRKEDVLAMAKRTLKEYGDKTIGQELNPRHLSEVADISLTRACQIIASFELGRRFYAKQAGRAAYVRNAKQAFQYLKSMGHGQKEQLRGLYLNSRYQVIHDEVISVGSLTSNVVHPREVFQPAIEHSAIALILAHNHPSGRLEPTLADIQITEQLVTAGQVLGIDLLDHLIITSTKYTSVMECIQHD